MSSGIYGERRPRSPCASARADQGLRYPLTESLDTTECTNGEQWPGWYDAHAQGNLNLRILRISKALFCMTRPIFIIFLDFYYISYKTWEITGACFNSHSARLKVSKLTQKIVITSYNHIHQIRWGFLVGKPTVSQMRTPHILPIQLMPAVLSEDPILL